MLGSLKSLKGKDFKVTLLLYDLLKISFITFNNYR